MALLMRRLFVDAQAKLRRMVEEHSASLAARIDSEFPNSVLPSPASASVASDSVKEGDPGDKGKLAPFDLDVKCLAELKKNSYSGSRPSSIDSKRSKSLCNTSSLESNDDARLKVEVKKCKSSPAEGSTETSPVGMAAEEERDQCPTPGKQQSSPETQSLGKPESPKPGCSSQQDLANDSTSPRSPRSFEGNKDEYQGLIPSPIVPLPAPANPMAVVTKRMRQENERLQAEVTRLRRLVISGAAAASLNAATSDLPEDSPERVQQLEAELQLAREAIAALRSDRKRLKAEKFDLLNQMKQLYATLEDKEKELRDFIRNYEERMRESESSLQQLSTEREERERERWSLLRHARDEAERSLSLAAQLNAKELQLQQAQEQLQEARRQLAASGCLSDQESLASLPRHGTNGGALTPGSGGLHHGMGLLPGDRGSCSADSGVRGSSDRESGGGTSAGGNLSDSTADGTPCNLASSRIIDVDSISLVSSIAPHSHVYQSVSNPKDCSPTLSPLNANAFSRSIDAGILSRSVEQLSSPLDVEPSVIGRRVKHPHSRPTGGRGGTWGSISRVFARSRHRSKANSLQDSVDIGYDPYRSWSPLTEEGYAEKLRLLREASTVPMERWRAPTVLAWLEIALGMPQYGPRCAENVKSGKIRGLHGQVLLELTDLELECGLGITHPMHRKKLRLAIEEHRHPGLVRYPCVSQLGHTWVSSEWLPDLGLSQYSENFAANLVDARMLDHLSKKELEKYLGVTRKFHQASIVHGIHLLRIMKYDRQALAVRRHQCEGMDADPLVWTNQRFIRWARNIDLGEYADNLKDSGVHGGLVVLEPSFNGDTMATALGIPPSKNIIRRHLAAELEALILPARSSIDQYVVRGRGSAGASSSFARSCGIPLSGPLGSDKLVEAESRRASLRGSLSRALGLTKSKSEKDKHSPTSSSEGSSIISRISPPLTRGALSGGESPVYSTPFNSRHSGGFVNSLILENDDDDEDEDEEDYEVPVNAKPAKTKRDFLESIIKKANGFPSPKIDKNGLLSNLIGGSLHRSKKQHRRVRSIGDMGDIDPAAPVSPA